MTILLIILIIIVAYATMAGVHMGLFRNYHGLDTSRRTERPHKGEAQLSVFWFVGLPILLCLYVKDFILKQIGDEQDGS